MTTAYRLSEAANKDLKEVTRYTLNSWGKDALKEYVGGLKKTFAAIGEGAVHGRSFSKRFPGLLVTKYRYHYVFYFTEGLEEPGIIGVIHERRDIVSRLRERLS